MFFFASKNQDYDLSHPIIQIMIVQHDSLQQRLLDLPVSA